ncbi:hypothetical protein ZWY2020_001158 [Hordeum vulgare]|nr:hypothetical protein ZWY2020_001158 [Hordeum vulgare]
MEWRRAPFAVRSHASFLPGELPRASGGRSARVAASEGSVNRPRAAVSGRRNARGAPPEQRNSRSEEPLRRISRPQAPDGSTPRPGRRPPADPSAAAAAGEGHARRLLFLLASELSRLLACLGPASLFSGLAWLACFFLLWL